MKRNFNATASYTICQLSNWIDSLQIPDMPADFADKLKKWAHLPNVDDLVPEVYPEHHNLFFTYQDNRPIIKSFSELSKDLSIEHNHLKNSFKTTDATQRKVQCYLQKIVTRLYQANPEILGSQPETVIFNPAYYQKEWIGKKKSNYKKEQENKGKGTFISLLYWPPRIDVNIYDFYNNRYANEDLVAWELAHELIHLTLVRQFVNRPQTPHEESICDLLGTVCMARAGYKPIETVLQWSLMVKQNDPLAKCLLQQESSPTLSVVDQYHLYDACERGVVSLPAEEANRLHQIFRLLPPLTTHPHYMIRMFYTNEMNNYLIDNQIISKEQASKEPTPIDPVVKKAVQEKAGMRTPVYLKKCSPKLKSKLLKRFQRRQKQYQ